jgi:tight adherence protein B
MSPPTSDEFRRARREVELGLPLHQALTNMSDRMESDDLYLVVTAININMQVGGNLSTILETVTDTIRNRIYLLGEVRSLTSYARYASYLLSFLPFFTVIALSILSPEYIEALLNPGITRMILIYASISLLIGNIWLRRLSRIDI